MFVLTQDLRHPVRLFIIHCKLCLCCYKTCDTPYVYSLFSVSCVCVATLLASDGVDLGKLRIAWIEDLRVGAQVVLQVPALSLVKAAHHEHVLLESGLRGVGRDRTGTDDQRAEQPGGHIPGAGPGEVGLRIDKSTPFN